MYFPAQGQFLFYSVCTEIIQISQLWDVLIPSSNVGFSQQAFFFLSPLLFHLREQHDTLAAVEFLDPGGTINFSQLWDTLIPSSTVRFLFSP